MSDTGIVRRPEIERFADCMEATLRKFDGRKTHWCHQTQAYLLQRVLEEVGELAYAMIEQPSRVSEEAVDIANLCMMIADNEDRRRR